MLGKPLFKTKSVLITRNNHNRGDDQSMQSKGLAVLPVVVILAIIAIASVGTMAIVKSATPSFSTTQNVQTGNLCTTAAPALVTVNIIKNGTWTSTVETAQRNNPGPCGGLPQQSTFGYSDTPLVILSASNRTFAFLLHINSKASKSATVSNMQVTNIERFNGNPEWQSVTYDPWNEVTNSSAIGTPFASGNVICCNDNYNTAALSDVKIQQQQPQTLTPPGILRYTISVNLPPGFYEITFFYTIMLANGSSTGSGASVPVTVVD